MIEYLTLNKKKFLTAFWITAGLMFTMISVIAIISDGFQSYYSDSLIQIVLGSIGLGILITIFVLILGLIHRAFENWVYSKKAALKFLKKVMRRHGRVDSLVTDKLRSYGAALKELGAAKRQEIGRWANDQAENSHLPFRRRERAMARSRRLRSLQKFASVHASICNHFNQDRGLSKRDHFKANRAAALVEWRGLCAN